MLTRVFRFFIYSNLFICTCAVLMTYQTSLLLLQTTPPVELIGFIFFSTLCSYSFHWWLSLDPIIFSDRVVWLHENRFVHLVLFIAGFGGAVFYFLYLLPIWPWLVLVAIATFLYSAPKIPHPWFRALRKVALGKTIFLAFVWMFVTTILPIVVAGNRWNTPSVLFVISRFFLVYAICILFDYRDKQDDKASGIRSLITYLDENGIKWLFYFSLAVFAVSTCWLFAYGYSPLLIMVLLVPGIIVWLLYNYARTHFSDTLYYFVLDGMMALSALLMLVARI